MSADNAGTAKSSSRPLEGVCVGISAALGEDSAARGFGEEEMNRVVVRVSDALLSAGARLVFGHDWRPSGIMSAIARLAVSYDSDLGRREGGDAACRITNLVPWDRRPELPQDLRNDLESRGLLRIEEVPLPSRLAGEEPKLADIVGARDAKRVLRAAALCALRKRLAALCNARICLGGKYQKYEGFFSGIFEEAFTSAQKRDGNTVLLSAILGGAAAKVLQAARSGNWDEFPFRNSDEKLLKGFDFAHQLAPDTFPDLRDFREVLSWERLQESSGLGERDWKTLVDARDIEVVSALAIKALSVRR